MSGGVIALNFIFCVFIDVEGDNTVNFTACYHKDYVVIICFYYAPCAMITHNVTSICVVYPII